MINSPKADLGRTSYGILVIIYVNDENKGESAIDLTYVKGSGGFDCRGLM